MQTCRCAGSDALNKTIAELSLQMIFKLEQCDPQSLLLSTASKVTCHLSKELANRLWFVLL